MFILVVNHDFLFITLYVGNSIESFETRNNEFMNPKCFIDVAIKIVYNNNNNDDKKKHQSNRRYKRKTRNKKKMFGQRLKYFQLYIANQFEYVHLSSMKQCKVYNRRMYKILSRNIIVGNVKDIKIDVWMVHACCLTKKRVECMYGQRSIQSKDDVWKQVLCNINQSEVLMHNCKYNKLFLLDPYVGRWRKLLYRLACKCKYCKIKL